MSNANRLVQKRVRFDSEITFSNGGGLQGQDFRLDLDGDDISDAPVRAFALLDV